MLHLCTLSGKCLILGAIQEIKPEKSDAIQQLALPAAGGFFGKPVDELIAELIESKKAGNRRDVYVKSLKHYLDRFQAGVSRKYIHEIDSAAVEKWILQYESAYSRQTWINRISTLFSFAVRKGYIESNPCDRVERVTIDHKPPAILTIEQSRAILAACPSMCRPWLILAMFSGIRPDGELMKLTWDRINLETATVKIDFPKVRSHRRIVPLEPIAVKLLSEHPVKSGPVAPSNSTIRRFKRKMRTMLGLERYPTDLLRHTAASYLLARNSGNASLIAGWLGNSVKILMSHYIEPVTKQAADEFFSICGNQPQISGDEKREDQQQEQEEGYLPGLA